MACIWPIRHKSMQEDLLPVHPAGDEDRRSKRVMITLSRCHGAGTSRVSAARVADLAQQAGSRTNSFVHFAPGGGPQQATRGSHSASHTGARSCRLRSLLQPSNHVRRWQAVLRWEKQVGMQARGAPVGAKTRTGCSGLHGADKAECSPVTPAAENTAWDGGLRGSLGRSGRT